MNFEKAVDFLFQPGIEGEHSMDPKDPGNWTGGKVGLGELTGTHWGIAASSGLPKPVSVDGARKLYRVHYWDNYRCAELPHPVDFLYFDARVNQWIIAAEMLQQAIVTLGEHIKVDGIVGPQTLAASKRMNAMELAAEFVARREMAYAMNPRVKDNPGWFRRIARAAFWAATQGGA